MNIKEIKHHTVDDGDCLNWKRGCSNGHPCIRLNGQTVLVRRALWVGLHGKIEKGKIIRMTCGSKKCINPDHMECTTFKKLGKELGAIGVMSGLKRIAAIAKTKRAGSQAKLNSNDVFEIRSSNETTVSLAKKFGVAQAHISKIRKNKCWREFNSPWASLLCATI